MIILYFAVLMTSRNVSTMIRDCMVCMAAAHVFNVGALVTVRMIHTITKTVLKKQTRSVRKKRSVSTRNILVLIAVEFVRITCFMMSEPERGRNIMIRFDVPTCAIRMVTARF